MIVLGIDPSIQNLGWAVINDDPAYGKIPFISMCTWHPSAARGAIDRFDQLTLFIHEAVESLMARDVVIETPGGGQRHSATQLMTYARAIGICEAAALLAGAKVHRASVTRWKGSARKTATAADVCARYKIDPKGKTDHEMDALALADWWLRIGRHIKD